jgi:putative transcriptional regulator
MSIVRKVIESADSNAGRIDKARVDATSERDIAEQQAIDEREAKQQAAAFARQVRHRLGLTQTEFSQRIDVSVETIRRWEKGQSAPTGAAKTLLQLLDKSPEIALEALATH